MTTPITKTTNTSAKGAAALPAQVKPTHTRVPNEVCFRRDNSQPNTTTSIQTPST